MKQRLLLAGMLSLLLSPAAFADVQATGIGGEIADDGTPFVSDITITENSTITNASFCLDDLQHMWVGDLTATVTHVESGLSATLFERVDRNGFGPGDSSNLNGTYVFDDQGRSFWTEAANGSTLYTMAPDTYQASDADGVFLSLNSIFAGQNTQGTWRLTVTDTDEQVVGQFSQWSIDIESTAVIPEPASAGLLAVGLIGLISRRRR